MEKPKSKIISLSEKDIEVLKLEYHESGLNEKQLASKYGFSLKLLRQIIFDKITTNEKLLVKDKKVTKPKKILERYCKYCAKALSGSTKSLFCEEHKNPKKRTIFTEKFNYIENHKINVSFSKPNLQYYDSI
jgi:hypothetical protein